MGSFMRRTRWSRPFYHLTSFWARTESKYGHQNANLENRNHSARYVCKYAYWKSDRYSHSSHNTRPLTNDFITLEVSWKFYYLMPGATDLVLNWIRLVTIWWSFFASLGCIQTWHNKLRHHETPVLRRCDYSSHDVILSVTGQLNWHGFSILTT